MTQNWTEPLSTREQEVLQLISGGLSNREIAKNLFLSLDTVKWYNKRLYAKLGVKNRTQAAQKANELGIPETQRSPALEADLLVGNLPAQINSYVGREREIGEIKELLKANRLVTLTGAGGSGKTRLALQVAEELAGMYPDGIWLVELASIRDASLVLETIASVLEISEKADIPLREVLKEKIHNKHILLVIDNFEHLLEAAPLIPELLATSPQLRILGTSRERLHVYGEQEYPVQPMSLPDIKSSWEGQELREIEAIDLFIQRAQAVKPSLSLDEDAIYHIAQICIRLDGLPLAIELCAPLVKVFPLSKLAARVENNLSSIPEGPHDLPARQQTLAKTLQWSTDLLDRAQKRLFERLAIFNGGGTLDAIKSICTTDIPVSAANLLLTLVNKNLVIAQERGDGEIHYSLLETVRQFNQERLRHQDELEHLSRLHAEYYTHLVQEAEKHLLGVDQVKWLELLEIEHDNLRAAFNWCGRTGGTADLGLRLVGSLETFWATRGYFSEGRKHIAAALSKPGASKRTLVRAKALHSAGLLAYIQGSYPETRLLLEEGISIYRELEKTDQRDMANTLITLGDMETELGNYDSAFGFMNEALIIMRDLNDKRGIARALWQLGACAVRPGKYDLAIQYFEEALIYLREIGERSSTAIAISGLAEVAIRRGDLDRAIALEEESIAMRREIDEPWGIAVSLGNFAWISLRQGDLDRSVNLLRDSLALRYEIGDRGGNAWCLEKMAEIALIHGQKNSNQNSKKKDFRRAAQLFGAAEAMREPVKSKIDLVDMPKYMRQVESLQAHMGEAAFHRAWNEGQRMSIQQAVEYALDDLDGK